MPLLSMILLAIPMEPAALCAMTEFRDIDPKTLDATMLDAVTTERPHCMPAYMLRGFAELDEDSPDRSAAIGYFEKAAELAPDNSNVLVAGAGLPDARAGRHVAR